MTRVGILSAATDEMPRQPVDSNIEVGLHGGLAEERRLRIAFLTDRFPLISETFVATLAADLVVASHDLRILTREATVPDGPMHDLVARAGLTGRIARAVPRGRFSASRALELAWTRPSRAPHLAGLWAVDRVVPRHALAVSRMLAAETLFDVVHCQFATLGLTAMRHRSYGTLRTRALVVHLRGSDISRFVEERGPRVYAALFSRAELFIANCRHFRDRALELGCLPEKVIVIGSPIDTDLFAPPAAPRPALDGRPLRLVAVGRLIEKKGFADAVEAVHRLRREGRAVTLDVLGEGALRDKLQAQIDQAGLGNAVWLHGSATQKQVISALHRADMALAPSVRARSGDEDAPVNTLKEAMATELPVVATRHGGIPDLVIPGENGELVPERDPGALAAAIAQIMDAPCRWTALGVAGRRKVVAEYDHKIILLRTIEAYRRALPDGR